MKNIHFFFLPLLCSALSMQAATLVVDNTSPSPGQYTTIAAAMTAAASGDTLLIQGTQTNYGNVFVTKSITLRGAGWSPIYKQTPYPTTLGIIYLASGVHDIKIEGIDLDILDQQANYGQYNITVQFCKIRGVIYYWTGCHDWLIRNNYFSSLENANIDAGGQSAYNLTVQHNIFQGYIYRFTSATNVFIDHNLFISPPSNVFAFAGGTNGLFCANNIFYTTFATSSSTITNCTFANNLTYHAQGFTNPLPTSGTNGNSVSYTGTDLRNTNPLFVKKVTATGGFSANDNYRLQSSSVGKAAGTDGKDIGIYTDIVTFSMTGEPETPAVRSLQITNPITTSGNNLIIKLTASKARRDGN